MGKNIYYGVSLAGDGKHDRVSLAGDLENRVSLAGGWRTCWSLPRRGLGSQLIEVRMDQHCLGNIFPKYFCLILIHISICLSV